MSDDKLIPPSHAREGLPQGPASVDSAVLPYVPTEYDEFSTAQPFDWRRYAFAILRYKWLLVIGLLAGATGAYVAWNTVEVSYTAEGNLWIEVERRETAGDVSPIRTGGLLQASSWIELLRTYSVLDSVVLALGLYVEAPEEYFEEFRSLKLAERYAPSSYELRVSADGRSFALATDDGTVVQRGAFGEPVGRDVGLLWRPAAGSFPADETIDFTIISPRDAARKLSEALNTRMAEQGNFLRLSLDGTNPELIASILNALMERHVELAAELKRGQLEEIRAILEEQLRYTEDELARAEQELEEFRVVTITLPSDRSTPISPGLAITRDPVYGNYFDMQVQLEQLRRDLALLEEVAAGFGEDGVPVEALEVIPSAAESSQLNLALVELVGARAELRALRARYADDYPPIQTLVSQIQSLESEVIPGAVDGILAQLRNRERQMQALVDSASVDLAAIPPRTIEEQRLTRRVQITEALYNELRRRVETARLAAASSIPDVRILDRAAVPQRPTLDDRLRWVAMILFGCLGAAIGGAILLDRMDSRFRYAADVSRDIGLGILGSIPRIKAVRGRGAENAAQALEAFRELRIHTGFAFGSAGPLTLTVTSPSEREGKSLIASNLAVAFAEVGKRTLLIDGDTRRGDAHRLVGRSRSPGLIDYLRQSNGQDIIQHTDHENLHFIGCGARGASTPELLASSRMALFFGTLKGSYDVIIVDSPPLASGGDPLILSSLTGNLAVVIRTGTTQKQLAQAKLDQLSRLPVRILGAILNDVDPSDAYHYYYSSYLPGYGPVPEGDDTEGVQLISGGSGGGSQAS